MGLIITFLIYLLLVVVGIWTFWRFFIRDPLREWYEERIREELRRKIRIHPPGGNTQVKRRSEDESLIPEEYTDQEVSYEEVRS